MGTSLAGRTLAGRTVINEATEMTATVPSTPVHVSAACSAAPSMLLMSLSVAPEPLSPMRRTMRPMPE